MNDVFSFLIISYNRPKDTIDAVANVLSLNDYDSFSKEIIIVNNASTDSYQIFEDYIAQISPEQKPLVQYIHSDKNLGVAGGRNLLIKKAKGKYLFFLDDDAEVNFPNVIQYIVETFEKYKEQKLGIIGCKGINPFTNEVERPIKNLALLKTNDEIFYYSFFGYGHVIKADILQQTGLYQDDFFYGMEEYDIAYATIKAGYTILYTDVVEVIHKQNPSGREIQDKTYARMFENKILVAYKHLPCIYVLTHFIMWKLFFLYKTKFNVKLYFQTLKSLFTRIKYSNRVVMNKNGLAYLKKVKARLWY